MFLERLEALVPWPLLEALIRRYYPEGEKGRRLYPLPVMLRVNLVQVCHNLNCSIMAGRLYDSEAVGRFVGLRCQVSSQTRAPYWTSATC